MIPNFMLTPHIAITLTGHRSPMAATADRATIAWLHRRAGFGLAPGELDARAADGVAATIDRLVDPDQHGVPAAPDPWQDVTLSAPQHRQGLSPADKKALRQQLRAEGVAAIGAWLDHLATTPRPLEDWMAWFWHGHLVSGLDKVEVPALLVRQLRTYRQLGLGSFPDLLKAATVDAAMLVYLDGRESTGTSPNENYGRELMELFSLGVGHYTEDDVKAAARALTGFRLRLGDAQPALVASRHDDTRHRLLGVDGVHDVDTVIAAVTGNSACAPFVAGRLARAILGPVDDGVVQDLARTFVANDLELRPLVRAILEAGAAGEGTGLVWAPVPWLAAAQRATGATITNKDRLALLRDAGQVPMFPPNVAGWPGGAAWFGASTVVARFNLASALAAATAPDNLAAAAAASGDVAALADALGRPEGFGDATRAALARRDLDARARLALALASPDHSLA
jgi:uncharacterized protein (DUF1800 family)